MKFSITKSNGKFIPTFPADFEAVKKIKEGEEILVTFTKNRNPEFHRKAFSLLKLGFDNQEKFERFDIYRKVLTIKAGYFTPLEDKFGNIQYIPDSLSYEQMTADDFEEWFEKVLNIIAGQLETAPEDIKAELSSYY